VCVCCRYLTAATTLVSGIGYVFAKDTFRLLKQRRQWYHSCWLGQCFDTVMALKWPIMCWCAVKKLLTHLTLFAGRQEVHPDLLRPGLLPNEQDITANTQGLCNSTMSVCLSLYHDAARVCCWLPTFSTGGTRPPLPHFFGLKFVQKLVHCCYWLLTETQCKIISVQQN